MTSELHSASLVSRLAISNTIHFPNGYYRSKLFVASFLPNTLVSAAGPLFSLLERLCLSPSLPPIQEIKNNIEHELKAFHSQLGTSNYPEDIKNIAHYLLCATIDEFLGKNYLRVHHFAPEFNAFTPLTADGSQPQQRFFEILEFIKDKPNQYLDLIELIYFCLIIGFEGEYHFKADGKQILDNHTEDVYQIIQKYRYNKPHRLFSDNPLPKTIENSYKITVITALVGLSLIIFTFFTSRFLLENKAEKVLFDHSQLVMLDN